jgi:hypothetical protein
MALPATIDKPTASTNVEVMPGKCKRIKALPATASHVDSTINPALYNRSASDHPAVANDPAIMKLRQLKSPATQARMPTVNGPTQSSASDLTSASLAKKAQKQLTAGGLSASESTKSNTPVSMH